MSTKNRPKTDVSGRTGVRSTGLEPVRSPTRPSNVRVCLFRHDRMTIAIIHSREMDVKKNFGEQAAWKMADATASLWGMWRLITAATGFPLFHYPFSIIHYAMAVDNRRYRITHFPLSISRQQQSIAPNSRLQPRYNTPPAWAWRRGSRARGRGRSACPCPP